MARRFAAVKPYLAALLFCSVLIAVPTRAQAQNADLQLVLAVDASASISYEEFAFQMTGLARAFRDDAVIKTIRAAAPNGMDVALVQWSGSMAHAVSVPWRHVADAASAAAFADAIDASPRLTAAGGTAIGDAVAFSIALILQSATEGARRVIDVSGDGRANQGIAPSATQIQAVAAGITVNGLAILDEEPDLDRYYQQQVIAGAGAFVMSALDYADYAIAIRRKLIREIGGAQIVFIPQPVPIHVAAVRPSGRPFAYRSLW